jgi:hypothetical protein
LALWTRGLSSGEVSQVYNAGKSGQGVSTVLVTPPAPTAKLNGVTVSSGKVNLSWNTGRLQSATKITGPWTDVTGVTGTAYSETPSGTKFFRLISP